MRELMWECRQATHCECQDEHLCRVDQLKQRYAQVLLDSKEDVHSVLKQWHFIVQEYMNRQLTYREDVLTAISGIASQFRERPLGKYYAGLWEAELPMGLLWQSEHRMVHRSGMHPDESKVEVCNTRPGSYTAPSWSWASIVGRVTWPFFWDLIVDQSCAEIKYIECASAGAHDLGKTSSGVVEVVGPAVEFLAEPVDERTIKEADGWFHCQLSQGEASELFWCDTLEDTEILVGHAFWCVAICKSRETAALVLRSASDGTYTRIGMQIFDGHGISPFDEAPHKSFRIV